MNSHTPYFAKLQKSLQNHGYGHPVLVIDLDILDKNIDASLPYFAGKNYRIVAKSMPCAPLLAHVAARAKSHSFMVFHRPFLNILLGKFPDADFLLGKPQPVQALEYFFKDLARDRAAKTIQQDDPTVIQRIQWLIDSHARLAQYLEVAKAHNLCFRIALEVDIGLHRGGYPNPAALQTSLELIRANPAHLKLAGFMGYEAHIASAPLASRAKMQKLATRAMCLYAEFIRYCQNDFADISDHLCINTGGTQTYQLYQNSNTANDMSIASGLLKPSDFDLKTTTGIEPCMFIATPVLKTLKRTAIPFLEPLSPLLAQILPAWRHSLFIYGGYWKAQPYSPRGLANNQLYARSTNQEMLNIKELHLKVDDYVFLRPTQSESVMLQFDNILLFRSGEYVGEWAPFKVPPSQALLTTPRQL